MRVFRKDSKGEFQEIFKHFPAMNWCKIMDGTSKYASNTMIKVALLLAKSKVPEFYKKCPLGPMIVEKNSTIENAVISLCPSGVYRIDVVWKYRNNEILLEFVCLLEVF